MDFAAKLGRLGSAGPAVHPERRPQAGVEGPARPPFSIPDALHGPDARVGRFAPNEAASLAPSVLAHLACDPTLASADPRRILFFDTETTGLNGGAGTLPFLIGLAWFEGDALRVRQLFLGQPGAEAPLLAELHQRIAASSLLVSFNGKSFDWPLLRTRFVLNRQPLPPLPPHLDLVHCARRVFKRRKQAGRLVELEASVLGHRRVGDIDGALIPAVYFDWLRRGQRGLLDQVFAHNAQDVVSMAAILVALARRLDSPEAHDAAEDCLSVAELAVRNQELSVAEKFALHAAEHARCVRATAEARLLAARLLAKRRDFAAARQQLERAASDAGVPRDLRAVLHLRLSQLCEHRFKDFPTAMHHAELGATAEPAQMAVRRLARLGARVR
jgi:hypothetical protein